jgi:hypothetical protein
MKVTLPQPGVASRVRLELANPAFERHPDHGSTDREG